MRQLLGRAGLLLIVMFGLGLLAARVSRDVQAQNPAEAWSEPVNLSRSGAASAPALVIGPSGTLQVFWWDQFDGLMAAIYDGQNWANPVSMPITMTIGTGKSATTKPLKEMPTVVPNGGGGALAVWRGEAEPARGLRPLWVSWLAPGSVLRSEPEIVAESALAWDFTPDRKGGLYLAYVRAARSAAAPPGVYVRYSNNGGASWFAPQMLYESIYFRLLKDEEAYVSLAASGDNVYVAWHDPRQARAFLSRSTDGGRRWESPQPIGEADESVTRPQIVAGEEGEVLLLWQSRHAAAPCALYQQRSTDGGASWGSRTRVLDKMDACSLEFQHTTDKQVLAIAGSGSTGLTVAAWREGRWSEPKPLQTAVRGAVASRIVFLDSLQLGSSGDTLILVGRGQDSEIWVMQGRAAVLEWIWAPAPPWSQPLALQAAGAPGLPAIAADAEGRLHMIWSEAPDAGQPGAALVYARWDAARQPESATVLRVSEGKIENPALAIVGDKLHAVWSGGRYGQIYYSQVALRDALAPDRWSKPALLPAPGLVGSSPALVADWQGALHVAYALPVNEGRGIYYTRSDNGGRSWADVRMVFDAAAAGWMATDHPSLAIDERGALYVAWVRTLPGGLPEEIMTSRSSDGGQSWSEPVVIVETLHATSLPDWPRLAATLKGQVHIVWSEVGARGGVWQRWSADGGAAWSPAVQAPGLRNVRAPVGLATDGSGALHLVAAGQDEAGEAALLYLAWDGARWGKVEVLRLAVRRPLEPGVALAVQPLLGRLSVAFRQAARAEVAGQAEASPLGVWYVQRAIPAVQALPMPVSTPEPTATPTLPPSPTPTPTPRPTVNPAPPPLSAVLELGPLTLPLTSLGGVLLAALVVVGVLVTRLLWLRRL